MKPKIKILSGIPCSGKSTYTKKYGDKYTILSRDSIREILYPSNYKQNGKAEEKVTKVFNNALHTLLMEEKNIIIDNTNVREGYIDSLLNTLKEYPNYIIEIKFFYIPLYRAKYRNILRYIRTGKWIPIKVMNNMFKNYSNLNQNKYKEYVR